MCGSWEIPSKGATGELEVGLGVYYTSGAHDVAVPLDLEPGLGGSAPAAEHSEAAVENAPHDRWSSWRRFMPRRKRAADQAQREAEPTNEISIVVPAASSSTGFAIRLNELVQVARDRSLQALNQYNGVEGLLIHLKTDREKGIRCDDEILQRRQKFGSNTYPCKRGKSFWSFIWKAAQFPLSLVMMLAAVIYSLLQIKRKAIHDGLYVEACIIFATVLDIIVRAIAEYWQSRQYEKLSEEKRNIRLEVIRGGRRLSVSTYDIVVGDIVPLKNGSQVPADGGLIAVNSLKVEKDIIKDPLLLSGSKVMEGIGTMLVTSVGKYTKWGRLMMEISHETDEKKPIQEYLKWLAISASCLVVWFASVACIVQLCRYFFGWTKKSDGTPMFILEKTTADEATEFVIKSLSFGIATIIVAVPVGLSIAALLNLANTTRIMMTNNALVHRLSACERMVSVTTVLCHKTGILTLNEMSVVDVWAGGIRMQDMDNLSQLSTFLKELIIEGIAQNTNGSVVFETGVIEVYGSPTEQAILSLGNKVGMKFDDARSSLLVHTILFNPNKKYGGVALQLGTQACVHYKGSAKIILNLCVSYMDGENNLRAIDEQQRKEQLKACVHEACVCAALAYRTYEPGSAYQTYEPGSAYQTYEPGSAYQTYEPGSPPPIDNLVLLAVIGIKDPCRLGTREAIQLCKSGGVKVCMVTEDDVLTAQAIAMECGILEDQSGHDITTGAQFRDLTDLEREQIAGGIVIARFSLVSADFFYRSVLTDWFKKWIEPKFKKHYYLYVKADVSLAMGGGGTAATKEKSDIIILDNNILTILKVIQCCRSRYTNIQRHVQFRLTVSVSAGAICVVDVVLYDAFPLNPVQFLLLNLIVDIFGALALAYRPTAHHLMGKPPVGKSDSLINKTMWSKLVLQVIFIVLFLAFINSDSILKLKLGHTGDAEKVMNTFIFNSLLFFLVFNEFEIRSLDQTFKEILGDNMFLITITLTIIFQIVLIQFLGIFISGVSLDLKKWLMSILVGLLSQAATHFPLQAYRY